MYDLFFSLNLYYLRGSVAPDNKIDGPKLSERNVGVSILGGSVCEAKHEISPSLS